MAQSLQSLLLAKISLGANLGLNALDIPEEIFALPKSPMERIFDESFTRTPSSEKEEEVIDEENELFGTSMLVYEETSEPDSTNSEALKDISLEVSTDKSSFKHNSNVTITASLVPTTNSRDAKDRNRLEIENESLRLQIDDLKQLKCDHEEEMRRLVNDNKSLLLQVQQQSKEISNSAKIFRDSEMILGELQLKIHELEEFKLSAKKSKLDQDATLQRLSSENGFLKAAQRDISAVNLSAEKKTAALESSKLAMFEQVKAIEQQLAESTTLTRKTQDSLKAAERQISQLDAENILLRQLRVELDASSRDCQQLRRQVTSLDAEANYLRIENAQLQIGVTGSSAGSSSSLPAAVNQNGAHSVDSNYQTSSRQSVHPPLNNKDRERELYSRSELPPERDFRPLGYPPTIPFVRDSVGHHLEQQQQLSNGRGAKNHISSYKSPANAQFRSSWDKQYDEKYDSPKEVVIVGDYTAHSIREREREHEGRRGSAVQSLADLMGGRRGSVDIAASTIKSFPSSGSYEREKCGNEGNTDNYSHTIVTPSVPMTAARRQSIPDTANRRGSSSGGGVSSFYDDNELSAGAGRTPFGTEQSVASTMISFEETDRRLTALTAEKASLYEESAKLLQRGGKILKERTRAQYVDARLEEIGKEISIERKKLSGKPG